MYKQLVFILFITGSLYLTAQGQGIAENYRFYTLIDSCSAAPIITPIRFRTKAETISIQLTLKKEGSQIQTDECAACVDLFSIDKDGNWTEHPLPQASNGTISDTYSLDGDPRNEYRLYLPAYHNIQQLRIGIPDTDTITVFPEAKEKPILLLGSSILEHRIGQRPKFRLANQLNRHIDRPVIVRPLIESRASFDSLTHQLVAPPKLIIVDVSQYLHRFSVDSISAILTNTVAAIRHRYVKAQILFVEAPNESQLYAAVNDAIRGLVTEFKKNDDDTYYLLSYPTHDSPLAPVDNYIKAIQEILKEKPGKISTTIPHRQYREYPFYDWQTRHNEILNYASKSETQVALLGNSILHYWGGKPSAPITRSQSSYDSLFIPLKVINMGFGWDRIENVLWRVYHDELDGFDAEKLLLLIGTNNLDVNTDKEIVQGIDFLLAAIQERQPNAEIFICAMLPRAGYESRITEINQLIQTLTTENQRNVIFINPGNQLLDKQTNTINKNLFLDGVHPNHTGYQLLKNEIYRMID